MSDRAAIYVRVSTAEQVANMSLGNQERECRAFAQRNGLSVVRVFREEGASATTMDRPVLLHLVSFVTEPRNKIGHVICFDASRFSRTGAEGIVLMNHLRDEFGVRLRYVLGDMDDTPGGEFSLGVLALMARMDNRMKEIRVRQGMAACAKQGRWMHAPPYGFRRGNSEGPSLVPNEHTAPHIRDAFDLFSRGHLPLAEVAVQMGRRGMRGRAGRPISPQTLRKRFLDRKYVGYMKTAFTDGLEIRGDWEPLVDDDVFARVQRVLARKSTSKRTNRKLRPEYPLKAHVWCSHCEGGLTASASPGASGKRYGYYRCHRKGCAGGVSIRVEKLHNLYRTHLAGFAPSDEALVLFREIVREVWDRRSVSLRRDRRTLAAAIDEAQTRKHKLFDLLTSDALSRDDIVEQIERVNGELSERRLALAEVEGDATDVEELVLYAEGALRRLADLWDDVDDSQRRALQTLIHPNGLPFDGEKFGTAETASIFKALEPATRAGSNMASPARFELALPA